MRRLHPSAKAVTLHWPIKILIAAILVVTECLAFGPCAFASSADSSTELTLDRALELARTANPDLNAVAQELKIAHGELRTASYLSPFNPEVASEGDYRPRTNQSNSQDWRVGLSQQIEIFGQRGLRIEASKLNLQERQAQFNDRLRLLNAAVKLSFFDASLAGAEVDVLKEMAALDQRLVKAAEIRFKAGEIGQIDFNLARVRQGESARAVIEGERAYHLRRSSLGRLLGDAAGPEPIPSNPNVRQFPTYQLEQLLARAMENRPDLRAHDLEISRLETEAKLNRRLALPNLKLGAFGGHENNTEYPMGLQVGFALPLFNRRQGEAEVLEGQVARAKALQKATQLDIEQQVRDALNSYQAAQESLEIYRKDVNQPAKESFRLLEQAFNAGKIDLLRLSVAEREAFQARMRYLEALFGTDSAQVSLETATGGTL